MGLTKQNCDLVRADISGAKWEEVNAEELNIENVSLSKTRINNVNMSKVIFNDVNLSEVKIQHANLTHSIIDHVHLFGTEFHYAVLPLEGEGNYQADGQYKPVSFTNCDLQRAQIKNCNLSNMEITDCDITGLKINGILVEDLLKKQAT